MTSIAAGYSWSASFFSVCVMSEIVAAVIVSAAAVIVSHVGASRWALRVTSAAEHIISHAVFISL